MKLPFTPESAKSKIDNYLNVENWTKLKKKHHSKVMLNSFSMFTLKRVLSKVGKRCITQSFTLGVKGLKYHFNTLKLCMQTQRSSVRYVMLMGLNKAKTAAHRCWRLTFIFLVLLVATGSYPFQHRRLSGHAVGFNIPFFYNLTLSFHSSNSLCTTTHFPLVCCAAFRALYAHRKIFHRLVGLVTCSLGEPISSCNCFT